MSQPQPLVSAIIPTYNRAREVTRAIDSALGQTYSNQEILVVDDGSSDGTREYLGERYADRIRCLPKPNGGVSSARNYGMKHARGELFAFLDSDDRWHPEHVAAQVEFFSAHPDYGMVLTDVQYTDTADADTWYLSRRDKIPVDGDVLRYVVRYPILTPSSAMIVRKVYDAVGGFDCSLQTAEDLDFHMRVAARFPIGVIERPLTRCTQGLEGLSALVGDAEANQVKAVERFVAAHRDVLEPRDCRAARFRAYTSSARGYVWAGDFRTVGRLFAKSMLCVTEPAQAGQLVGLGWTVMRNLASRLGRHLPGR
ncbi:MAG: glycosyltransferase [Polyangiaceae bacterium]|nr:glycosyltransferase [Polyangiaceae bacterium]